MRKPKPINPPRELTPKELEKYCQLEQLRQELAELKAQGAPDVRTGNGY
ncbi:Hypothetical protein VOLT_2 [Glutamicibacter phage Voltaire]|nr:Hypothetical protein QEJ64_gp02 [Glutamicibacter phage Voltaire]CAH1191432.1 Hypothetical protein VOLT_2 [Glutamicibacter phage Voltaire]